MLHKSNMILREAFYNDLPLIDKLNHAQKYFKIDNLDNLIIDRLVFDDNGKSVAYGMVKKLAEAILLVNPEAPLLIRAKAMRELMQYAEFGAKKEGCDQLHCFVSDLRLAKALVKHYGFIKSEDIVLVKNL